jgi:hypothetical protein
MGSRDADGGMRNTEERALRTASAGAEPRAPPGRLDGYVENPSEHQEIGHAMRDTHWG